MMERMGMLGWITMMTDQCPFVLSALKWLSGTWEPFLSNFIAPLSHRILGEARKCVYLHLIFV